MMARQINHSKIGTNKSALWVFDSAEAGTGSDVEAAIEQARSDGILIEREFRQQRLIPAFMEPRSVVVDPTGEQMTMWSATQIPHILRFALAATTGVPESKIRVIAPDVGGGFGGKNRLMPEEVAVAALAIKLGHPLRWIEDRREHLMCSVHCRDHYYDLTISAERDGTLLGVEGEVYIDAGAYSLWPTGSFMEASMASRNLTGPYRIRHLNLKTYTVATNKAPMGPYRGVARPGACFAIERLVDEVARELKQIGRAHV